MVVLGIGDRGAYVELLQLGLSRSGYLEDVDGIFGPLTEAALRTFQQNFGLPPTGRTDDATWKYIYNYIRGYVMYTIRQGDTFYNLAQRYGTTVRAITTANPGVEPASIQIGQRIVLPFGYRVVPSNVSYTYILVSLITDGLARRYPFIEKGRIGLSVMGKELISLKMGTGDRKVFINASHHANEWITTPLVLTFLESYAIAYSRSDRIGGEDAADLYESATLFMVPLVNPDGVDLVNGVVTGSFFEEAQRIAANYPSIPFPSGWKANIVGIDPNLSYPARWEEAREIKFAQGFTSPAPRDYVGPAVLSAVESRAMYDFTNAVRFDLTISYHTQGGEIYYSFLDIVPPRGREIGEEFARVSGYTLTDVPYESAFAGYKDWVIQDFNVPSYTIEAGRGVNPLPLSQFFEIYSDNLGIMTKALIY
jgi:g-D-glutamyl-meso-diaminopimelate peptidase